MNKILIPALLLLLFAAVTEAQDNKPITGHTVGFNSYLRLVEEHNIGFAAEKYNITIAEAAVRVAKLRPDPYISADVSRSMEDNENRSLEFAPEAGITIETAGKRKARIDLAKSEAAMTKAGVDDFFRNLRADAALLYLEALRLEKMYRVSLNSYNTMKQLSTADSIRFRLGTIMEIDATQSRVEAGILNNESALAFSRWQNALVQLSVMAGKAFGDTLIISTDLKNDSCRYFDINILTIKALEKRSDLLAAGFEKEAAENALRLARRNRISDFDLRAASAATYIPGTGSNSLTSLGGGISIPLKFSNFNKGELDMAKAKIYQSEERYREAELVIRKEVSEAVNLYKAYCIQVDNFEKGLREMALKVMNGKIYSYRRGETDLLEVLNAQRTFNDIEAANYEALYNRAAALVNLERAAAIWDIDFE